MLRNRPNFALAFNHSINQSSRPILIFSFPFTPLTSRATRSSRPSHLNLAPNPLSTDTEDVNPKDLFKSRGRLQLSLITMDADRFSIGSRLKTYELTCSRMLESEYALAVWKHYIRDCRSSPNCFMSLCRSLVLLYLSALKILHTTGCDIT